MCFRLDEKVDFVTSIKENPLSGRLRDNRRPSETAHEFDEAFEPFWMFGVCYPQRPQHTGNDTQHEYDADHGFSLVGCEPSG